MQNQSVETKHRQLKREATFLEKTFLKAKKHLFTKSKTLSKHAINNHKTNEHTREIIDEKDDNIYKKKIEGTQEETCQLKTIKTTQIYARKRILSKV